LSTTPGLGNAELPMERVVITLEDGTRIEGTITMPRRGARLSDFLAQSDREFFTVADARITLPSGEAEEVSFALLAGRFVKMVTPARPPAAS
jgi:hypothetical protein